MQGTGRGRAARLVAAAASAAVVALLTASCGPHGRGPVTFAAGETVELAGVHASAGDRVVFGAATVHNTGSQAATLLAGRLVGDVDPTDAVVAEVRVVDLGPVPGTGDLLGAGVWPVAGFRQWWAHAVPVEGARLPAGHAAEVVYLVRVLETGDLRWPLSALDYRAGGAERTAESSFGFEVCPPAPGRCGR
jgi:hypothetical protein